ANLFVSWSVCTVGIVFFFSSRRRHTRSKRDWSSDVCSSDLVAVHTFVIPVEVQVPRELFRVGPGALVADLVGGLADVQMGVGTGSHLLPPGNQNGVVGDGQSDLPVHLRVDVVEPPLEDPLATVGVLIV